MVCLGFTMEVTTKMRSNRLVGNFKPCQNSSASCPRQQQQHWTSQRPPWSPPPLPAAAVWSFPERNTWRSPPPQPLLHPVDAEQASSCGKEIHGLLYHRVRWDFVPFQTNVMELTLPPPALQCVGWRRSRTWFSTEPPRSLPWRGSGAAPLWPPAPPRTAPSAAHSRVELIANYEPGCF